jgi:ABC-type transporter Mla maintaining outer membrane lipid asymmetry ATPase subunit MlaF
LIFLHEGRILAQGTSDVFDRSEIPLVRQFMTSTGAG